MIRLLHVGHWLVADNINTTPVYDWRELRGRSPGWWDYVKIRRGEVQSHQLLKATHVGDPQEVSCEFTTYRTLQRELQDWIAPGKKYGQALEPSGQTRWFWNCCCDFHPCQMKVDDAFFTLLPPPPEKTKLKKRKWLHVKPLSSKWLLAGCGWKNTWTKELQLVLQHQLVVITAWKIKWLFFPSFTRSSSYCCHF